jgi:dihydroorotate dehydrogenase (fumarate)
MTDLRTTYLGLALDNPLVPSASPLSRDLGTAQRLEDAGAGALVMHSLFEEETRHEEQHMERFLHYQAIGHAEAESFHPLPAEYHSRLDEHLEQLHQLKQHLDIPVIASLNGVSLDGWVDYGRELQQAGADALELNVYYVAADINESAVEVEHRYLELLRELRAHVDVPITMKLSPHFTALAHMVRQLEQAGASGVALFNRFYQPDIDLDTLRITHQLELSTSREALLRIRWIAILRGRVELSLAATGGLHNVDDIIKALLAGADVTHLCSALLQHGPQRLGVLRQQLAAWMEEQEYESVSQLKGSISQQCALDPAAFERANYVSVIDSYTPSSGIMR